MNNQNDSEPKNNSHLIPAGKLAEAVISQNPSAYRLETTKPITPPKSEDAEGDFAEEFPEDFPDYVDYNPNALPELLGSEQVQILRKREDTRGTLAIVYTLATFAMFVLGFIAAFIDAVVRQISIVEGLTTILPLISGVFLGSLGFVLGYYFRKSEE